MDGRPTCADDASRLPADGTYDEEASIVSGPLVFVNVPLYTGEFSLSADRGGSPVGSPPPVQYEPEVRRYANALPVECRSENGQQNRSLRGNAAERTKAARTISAHLYVARRTPQTQSRPPRLKRVSSTRTGRTARGGTGAG